MLFGNITESVGQTPMVALRRMSKGLDAHIVCKLESRNPCGSVKDRVGVALIEDAERRGVLKPGATLVEPTSGNTGVALAFAAAAKGYTLLLTMPERISRERVALLRFLGAEVVLTPGALMQNAVDKANELVGSIDGAVMLQQFDNPANPEVHRRTTAVEILEDLKAASERDGYRGSAGGKVDVFVAGVGTGGTITGVGEVLKENNPDAHVVAVEPASAAVLSGKQPGQHYLPGLGAGFVPKVLNRDVIDQVVAVTENTAFEHQQRLAREEGISAGISCGAAVAAALHVARQRKRAETIVVVLPDGGERYVTSPMYEELVKSFAS
jgi:cysteine synthase A